MEFRVEFDLVARIELYATRDWIAEKSPEQADKWLLGMLARIKTLRKMPRRNPVAREGLISGIKIRELHYGKRQQGVQRILYLVEDDLVRILSIRHSSRGFESL